MSKKSIPLIILMSIALIVLALFNPEHIPFPRCPFLMMTGFQCPGCGSQRAIHHLLHGHLIRASQMNLLFLPGIAYAGTGFLLSMVSPNQWPSIQRTWFGKKAAYLSLIIVLSFWILRNIV